MKWNLTIILMGAMLVMASCTEKEVASPEVGTLEFRVDTRAEGTAGTQKVRLYVVDRRPELDVFTNPLCLYCPPEWQMDLASPDASGKTAYTLDHLLAQWYKFAFVCVPSEVKYAGAESLDFTRQWLDYSPVLLQSNQTDGKDRSVYRQVMDRWLKKEENLTENVTLERITGQLIVDMGILTDQFEKEVKNVEVELKNVPKGIYVHEQSDGEILPVEEKADYIYTGAVNGAGHYIIRANLFPMPLVDCKVKVVFIDGTSVTYPLVTNAEIVEQQQMAIKENTRTTLYFNGMEDNEFEVRYAGFAEGDASISIDDDDWDGWQDYFVVEYAVKEQGVSQSRAGVSDSRVQSLTYLLYQQMGEDQYYLIRKREIPDMANAQWPLSRENGMTWEQREALKDTLLVGVNYKAVFVANAAEVGRLTEVNVMEDNEELTGVSTYTDARLVLPDVVTPTNLFYLAVKDIDGTAASHDTPTHCGVVLQRAVTRTDILCGDEPEVQDLVGREDIWSYIETQYKEAVSALNILVPDAVSGFEQIKDVSYGEGTVGSILESTMQTDLATNPLWNCFSAETVSVTYQSGTFANRMDLNRVSENSMPNVTKMATSSNGMFSYYAFGANAADNTQNVISNVTMGSVSIATDLKTNQGINEYYTMECTPFGTFLQSSTEVKELELTLNIWDMFVDDPSDDKKNALNAALADTGNTIEAFMITLKYPDLSKQTVWEPSWNIQKQE